MCIWTEGTMSILPEPSVPSWTPPTPRGARTGGPSAHGWQQITPGETQHSSSTTLNFTLCLETEHVEMQQICHFLELNFIYIIFSNICILVLESRDWTGLKASSKPALVANLLAASGSFRGASAVPKLSFTGRDAGQFRILKRLLHGHWG